MSQSLVWTDSSGRTLTFEYTGEVSLSPAKEDKLKADLELGLDRLFLADSPRDVDALADGIVNVAKELHLSCSREVAKSYAKHVLEVLSTG